MTTTVTEPSTTPDHRWLRKAEHWGEWIRFDETTGERESIWMMKSTSSPKVRFYAVGKGQIGAEHAHIAAATCWAYASGYLHAEAYEDPQQMLLGIACRAEILAGGVSRDAHLGSAS